MPHGSAPRDGRAAAAASPVRSSSPRRRQPVADELERLSFRMDALIRDVRLGATSHRQYEAYVAEAEAISEVLRALFRGTPSHPPIRHEQGRAWW